MPRFHSILTEDAAVSLEAEGPSVLSPNPEERKLARQLRIQRRIAAIKANQIREMGEEVLEKSPIEIQMEKSAEVLEKFLDESKEYLENIKLANEAREVDRRETEGIGRLDVMAQLEAEAAEAHRQFNEIAGRWAGIHDYKDPLHINEDMLEQKIKCDELIQQKDEIIDMLKKELCSAERKFTRDQIKQNLDIQILGQRIEKQINFMKSAYNTEYMLIDQVINDEKQKFIDRNYKRWEDLSNTRTTEEIALSEYMLRKQEEITNTVDNLILYNEDEFRRTKIQLEMDIQQAQDEFERIKYLVLTNSEKLDYDYQVLKSRENENIIIKAQQKRRISKMQDAISDLRNTLKTYKQTTIQQIKKTQENILKMHKNILDTDAKADHFAAVNEKQFNEVWKMNTEECIGLLEKVFSIDKILHEQQMGVKWERSLVVREPDKLSMPSYCRGLEILQKESSMNSKQMETKTSQPTSNKVTASNTNLYYASSHLIKVILTKLSTKSKFLTEKRLKNMINIYEDDEQTLVTLNNVFISLDIKKPEDVDLLLKYFLPYCYCPVCVDGPLSHHSSFVSSIWPPHHMSQTSSSRSSLMLKSEYYNPSVADLNIASEAIQQYDDLIDDIVLEVIGSESIIDERGLIKLKANEAAIIENFDRKQEIKEQHTSKKKPIITKESDRIMCSNHHPLYISTIYILCALKNFVMNYYTQEHERLTVAQRLAKRRLTMSRLLDDADITKYWHNLRSSYNKSTIDIWNNLCEGLVKYHEILKERKNVSEDVLKLRKRNRDLKKLLAEYMDHGVLMPAPCSIQVKVADKESIWRNYLTASNTVSESLNNTEEPDPCDLSNKNYITEENNSSIDETPSISFEYPEEIDNFEETCSTHSLSSEDNKVHLKKILNFERRSLIPVPIPTDINKMKLDFNRINELDRFRNIIPSRNIFCPVLRTKSERYRKTFLKDLDSIAGPSSLPLKKRKRMKAPIPDNDDDVSPLDDMKSVTNCIVENTLNKINVDADKEINKDNIIKFNNASVTGPVLEENYLNLSERIEIPQEFMDCDFFDSTSIIDVRDSDGHNNSIHLKDIILDSNIISYNMHIPSPSREVPPIPPVPPPLPPRVTPINEDAINEDSPNQSSIHGPDAAAGQPQSEDVSLIQDVISEDVTEPIASSVEQASREAIVDPNSVVDLLEDFDIPTPIDDINGVNIVDLQNVIIVGLLHSLPENLDTEATNGFPNWLLQILGSQITVEENAHVPAAEEPHFYCQGDGLGVHPSVLAVEVNDEDEEDNESSESTNNTADFAEVDPGVSSQEMSSLPEDSLGNIQDPLEDETENRDPATAATQLQTELSDTVSSSSDTDK